jgi:hypothetical protein
MPRRQLYQLLADQHAGPVAAYRILDTAAARIDERLGIGEFEHALVLAGDDVV